MIYFFILVFLNMSCHAYEFLYPLTTYQDQNSITKVLVLYQKSLAHTELWSWDPVTHQATKLLLSSFSPAGVCMLPDDRGFSFIDNGRIRIKEFIKRSPKSIEIYEPLSNIGRVTWSSTGIGYFSAQEHTRYHIFSLTLSGDTARFISYPDTDCIYPCPLGSKLFYIERSRIHRTQETLFLPGRDVEHSIYKVIEHGSNSLQENVRLVIADFGQQPIMYLTMVSMSEGFVVAHAPCIDTSESTVDFMFYRLVSDRDKENEWRRDYLFSFSIPSYLLLPTSDGRLYESILPLLPRVRGDIIYYVDTDLSTLSLLPYRYKVSIHQKNSCISDTVTMGHSFVPLPVHSSILFGGSLHVQESLHKGHQGTHMYFDQKDNLCFEFPILKV